jgi:hypothetical protein
MTKLGFAESYKRALADAREVSELWTGTLIADTIDAKIEALIEAVDNGEAVIATYELLPELVEETNRAKELYEQQETGVEW